MFNVSLRNVIALFFLLAASSVFAQNKVVVVPLGGDDIERCEVSTVCQDGFATLTCPSGVKNVPCQAPKTVFVTSITYTGNLGGIAGADMKCQERADIAELSGEFKAWLSDGSGLSPSTNFVTRSSGEYVGTAGDQLWKSSDLLFFGRGPQLPRTDEFGMAGSMSTSPVWTNTGTSGEALKEFFAFDHCDGFTDATQTSAIVGYVGSGSDQWTEATTLSCADQAALYCFEQ